MSAILIKQFCSLCAIEKPISDFHFRKDQNKYRKNCKECGQKTQRRHYKNNSEDILKKQREAYKNNPSHFRSLNMKYRYGIGLAEYDKMFRQQNETCAICKTKKIHKNSHRLHIDHSHVTGAVRGLLCSQCNTAIGQFQENITFLKNAIAYLRRHSE